MAGRNTRLAIFKSLLTARVLRFFQSQLPAWVFRFFQLHFIGVESPLGCGDKNDTAFILSLRGSLRIISIRQLSEKINANQKKFTAMRSLFPPRAFFIFSLLRRLTRPASPPPIPLGWVRLPGLLTARRTGTGGQYMLSGWLSRSCLPSVVRKLLSFQTVPPLKK